MLRPGARSVAVGATLAASVCAIGCDGSLEPSACSRPSVSQIAAIPNQTNVLSEMVSAHVDQSDSAIVQFGTETKLDSATPSYSVIGDSVAAVVLGLRPSTSYRAQIVAFNHCGTTASEVVSFTTEALPSDIPTYSASGASPSRGYVVFAAATYGLVIDNTGRVVWYHHFANGPGLNFQPQPDGRYVARPPVAAGEIANWTEIAPDGSVTRTLGCARGMPPRMHDMIAQPDGSYWTICDETRTVDLSAQGKSAAANVLGADVEERSATGEMLFEWSAFDHLGIDLSVLDPVDLAGPVINWTHANALDLDSDGNLILSFRNLSEITKVDIHTGKVMWRMGGLQNQFTFENVDGVPFLHQHGVRSAGAGQLVLLDNLGEQHSQAERYEVNEALHVARLTRAYVSTNGVIAQIGGSTQTLSDGHTLVAFGNGGALEEYDEMGNVVWRLEGNPGYVFRAERIRSLYTPGVGDPR